MLFPDPQRVFKIESEETFLSLALELFDYQSTHVPIYRDFCKLTLKKSPTTLHEIPFLPIDFFKTHEVKPTHLNIQTTFRSSGTTSNNRSQHHICDLSIYEESFVLSYEKHMGNLENQVILALLPNYLEQGESSLVYMVQRLIELSKSNLSTFVLNDFSALKTGYDSALQAGKTPVIIGVSYALLDLIHLNVSFDEAIIIETGGMKGRRKELSKSELHQTLSTGLHVNKIFSEYGMTELLSQAYSTGNGIFDTPNWMRILIRDTEDPFHIIDKEQKTGGINIIDLANIYSCCFIATQDLGKLNQKQFEILGRFDHSDIRGCNLLIN